LPDAKKPLGALTRFLVVLAAALWAGGAAAERLVVVATTPDLASIASLVGGELVHAESLVAPGADAESFEPRPGHLAKLKGAVLVVRVGLGYDHWLDGLLQQSGEPRLQKGGLAHVDASIGIPLLEVQGRSIEGKGHAHGAANPHYWLDPSNGAIIAAAIAEGLLAVAPELRDRIIEGYDRFIAELMAREQRWAAALASHRGTRLVAYHNSWPYFARHFRLNIVEVIEPKEGVAPSPARIARLVTLMKKEGVGAILNETFAPKDAAQLLARSTGAKIVLLAPSVGGADDASDYLALFERNVGALASALGG
jgi:ABC-type Zn uptake system ZnuABC Zn-binding protein ZnuA